MLTFTIRDAIRMPSNVIQVTSSLPARWGFRIYHASRPTWSSCWPCTPWPNPHRWRRGCIWSEKMQSQNCKWKKAAPNTFAQKKTQVKCWWNWHLKKKHALHQNPLSSYFFFATTTTAAATTTTRLVCHLS